ncbi:type I secretion system permease/ATPase [Burkholderia glumae]|uniref:type I secretion system permease/ATPase n=1 Tax=Burkholderia glumae TaxID=337 RepID=UPI000C279B63|nr:type I secretion system permease/ATPase [Burkholderia glumae]PJO20570.1 type I secretion system permease/ATPase [Burkholderia glumae AU6208]QHE12672.1 type I secretion system permease/ATPase [Burkholderia glumae AU6208]
MNAPDNNTDITRIQDDPALACLVVIARFHGIATDTAQLRHAAARGEQPFDSDALILTARSIGLKARRVPFSVDRLDRSPLPALCIGHDGKHFIVARKDGDAVVAFEAGSTQPVLLSKDDTARRSTGYMIVFASRASLTGELAKFDFSWFIPAVVKYRRLLLEVLGISLILQVFGLVTPLMFQVIMDKVLVSRTFNTLAVVGVTLFVCSTFEVILTALRNFIFSHTTNRIDVELGARLFRHLIALPLPYFGSRRVGDTIARVRELENIRNFLTGQALTAVIDLFFSIVFIAVMCLYSIWLTVVVVLSLPLYAGVSAALVPALRQRLNEKFARGADNQSFLVEAVSGVETVKAMSVEPQFTKKWEMQLAAYVASGFRVTQLGNIGQQLIQYIGKLVSLATLILGAKFVIDGKLTIGELIAFNMMSQRVAAPVLRLAQLWQDFQQVGISMSRLGDILNTRTEMRQSTQAMPPLKGDIRFEHVRFRYRPDGKPILDEVSLEIRAGQVIGIVGRSGSGKSTLTKLLQRLYVPEHGTVRIDGIDLSLADPAWLRRHIGVVLQENYLFNRSVRENIALSDPGAPMAAVIQAAKLAGAHDFICELPQAYDTPIEEHGGNLSGGQRQRIAIARALLTNPRILIFDEATSALDFETERIIQNNMRAICAGRTVIIIAHRLSTVRHADQIFAMDQGRIIERGTHDSLQAGGGYYAHLLSLQHG